MSIVLLKVLVLFENLWEQGGNVIAYILNLMIIIMKFRIVIFTMKLNDAWSLVKSCFDSLLRYHLGNNLLWFYRWDFKEGSKLVELDVLIDFWDNLNIVLDQSLAKNWKSIRRYDFLMSLERILEHSDIRSLDNFAKVHFVKNFKVIELLASDIFVKDSENSCFLRSSRGQQSTG